jgi:hypothetical protein
MLGDNGLAGCRPGDVTGNVAKTPREPCKKRVPERQSERNARLSRQRLSLKLKELKIGIDVALRSDGIVSDKPRPPARREGGPR